MEMTIVYGGQYQVGQKRVVRVASACDAIQAVAEATKASMYGAWGIMHEPILKGHGCAFAIHDDTDPVIVSWAWGLPLEADGQAVSLLPREKVRYCFGQWAIADTAILSATESK